MSTHQEDLSIRNPARIAVFASGSGSNALSLMQRFNKDSVIAQVVFLLTNKPDCGAVQHANACGVEVVLLTRENFILGNDVILRLREARVGFLVLAGFLWKVPVNVVTAFESCIINLHPSLLPKFGGKGMYGRHVHEAVWKAKERQTGITVHIVNEHYDEGSIIFQVSVPLDERDGINEIERKVRELERNYFCNTVERFVTEFRITNK